MAMARRLALAVAAVLSACWSGGALVQAATVRAARVATTLVDYPTTACDGSSAALTAPCPTAVSANPTFAIGVNTTLVNTAIPYFAFDNIVVRPCPPLPPPLQRARSLSPRSAHSIPRARTNAGGGECERVLRHRRPADDQPGRRCHGHRQLYQLYALARSNRLVRPAAGARSGEAMKRGLTHGPPAGRLKNARRLPSTLTFANAGTQAPALNGSFTFQAFSSGCVVLCRHALHPLLVIAHAGVLSHPATAALITPNPTPPPCLCTGAHISNCFTPSLSPPSHLRPPSLPSPSLPLASLPPPSLSPPCSPSSLLTFAYFLVHRLRASAIGTR